MREDVQVIVVDDCSTNDLDELLNLKNDYKWVEWYETGTNGGGGKARNVGLRHAKGKYLIFADSDDYFLPRSVDIWDEVIKDNPQKEIIYFGVECRDSNSGEVSYRNNNKEISYIRFKNRPYQLEKWMRYCYSEPWGKIINRDFIVNNQIFFQESRVANDFMFSILIGYHAKKIIFINTPRYYVYTVRSDSLSINQFESPLKLQERLNVYYDVELFCIKNMIGIFPFSRFYSAIFIKHTRWMSSLKIFCKNRNLNFYYILLTSLINTFKYIIISRLFKTDVI